jgi:hypothetical protein
MSCSHASIFAHPLQVAPEQNLLRWFNFHLRRAGSPKQVTNFGPDLKDSEAYILLFTQVAPQCADRCASVTFYQHFIHNLSLVTR